MNAKTFILLAVLGLVAFLLYYFTRKENSQITVDQKSTSTVTGLSSLLNTGGGANIITGLFGLNSGQSNAPKTSNTPLAPNPTGTESKPSVGIGGEPINTSGLA